jgi:DNA replication protein DnaC
MWIGENNLSVTKGDLCLTCTTIRGATDVTEIMQLLTQLAKMDVLVSDDLGLRTDAACRDLLGIFDDRHNHRSILVTSQLPLAH